MFTTRRTATAGAGLRSLPERKPSLMPGDRGPLRRVLRLILPPVAMMSALVGLAPDAHADVVGTSTRQLTSLWTYISDEPCVAMMEETNRIPLDGVQFWETAVAASRRSGESSWAVTIKGFLTLSYAPNPDCQSDWVLNSYDLAVAGEAFYWNGSRWTVCEVNPSSAQFPGWSDTPAVTWGFQAPGDVGSGYCGAGWYYSAGEGIAFENGAWQGYSRYWTNAGDSGPIWMN